MRWSVLSERMCVGMRQWMESKYLNKKTRLIDKKSIFCNADEAEVSRFGFAQL